MAGRSFMGAPALAETNVNAGLSALLALVAAAAREHSAIWLMALKKFPFDSLSLTQKLEKLRIIELSFIRQENPILISPNSRSKSSTASIRRRMSHES